MSTFKATHRITFTDARGRRRQTTVMLVDGVGYTRGEYDSGSPADWERHDNGRWYFQGQATPGGANGTVRVVALPKRSSRRPVSDRGGRPRKRAEKRNGPARKYTVTYRLPVDASEEDYNTVRNLSDRATLATVRRNCRDIGCSARLADAAGFTRAYVHEDGDYTRV